MRTTGLPLALGALALAAVIVDLPAVARVPFGVLAADVAMAWGILALLRTAGGLGQLRDAPILALAPFLGIPAVAVRLRHALGGGLPAWVEGTLAPHAILLALAIGAMTLPRGVRGARDARDRAIVVGAAGGLALASLLAAFALARPPGRGPVLVLATALCLLAAALVVQWRVAAWRPALARFGTSAALAVAASQLLDGLVTYLSVIDPLDLLETTLREQVRLSALILDATGVGYPIAKWGLALVIVHAVDGARGTRHGDAASRIGLYLLVIFLGLGPGLYSSMQLLSA